MIINNKKFAYSLLILLACVAYGLLQAHSFHRLVPLPFAQYALCGMLDALFLFGLTYLLWKVVKHGNFEALDIRQRSVNYFVLGLLFFGVWNVLSFATLYLAFGEGLMEEITNISYTKGILCFLIYPLIVLFFQMQLKKQDVEAANEEETDEIVDDEIVIQRKESIENVVEMPQLEKLERIAVKTGQKLDVVAISEIVYFQADGDYVRIVTDTGKHLKEDTLKFYQARLPETEFVRVHRSYLVNVTKILRIELYEKQSHLLSLSNGDKLKISASGYKRLREVLGL